jgi:hypothetical protein
MSTPSKASKPAATTPLTKSKLCQVTTAVASLSINAFASDDDDDDEDEIFFGAVTSKECLQGINVINQELCTAPVVEEEKEKAIPEDEPESEPTTATMNISIPATDIVEAVPAPALVAPSPDLPVDPPVSKLPTRIARPSRLRAPKSSVRGVVSLSMFEQCEAMVV